MICFIIGMPCLFLTFNNRQETLSTQEKKICSGNTYKLYTISCDTHITIILYIYFTTIFLSWSLPKGGNCIYGIRFYANYGIGKGPCNHFYTNKYTTGITDITVSISIPAQLMFWIGEYYIEFNNTDLRQHEFIWLSVDLLCR